MTKSAFEVNLKKVLLILLTFYVTKFNIPVDSQKTYSFYLTDSTNEIINTNLHFSNLTTETARAF